MGITLSDKIQAFSELGKQLNSPAFRTTLDEWAFKAYQTNNWFTETSVFQSLQNIAKGYLDAERLRTWTNGYRFPQSFSPKRVGLILAGNIPAVGFHDILCVLMAGHKALIKASSQDFVLIKEIIKQIIEIEPRFAEQIEWTERLNHAEMLIATGSDNSARYFEYYFRDKPHIIRKNRTSVAVLNGNETASDFEGLGNDILSYYGLGCRNVSKLFVPADYDFTAFYEAIEDQGDVFLHHKYKNNYDYNKSIYLVNQQPHYDNGFLILKPDETLVSPISVCFYEHYTDQHQLSAQLTAFEPKIQCIASANAWWPHSVAFGTTQQPNLTDYADQVDTLKFLLEN
ncbi:MAG: acyl-CoA reductase [Spirosomataceae bacterium]